MGVANDIRVVTRREERWDRGPPPRHHDRSRVGTGISGDRFDAGPRQPGRTQTRAGLWLAEGEDPGP
jgi:hypothetical protein